MSTHLPRKNGLIQLERTGPFVPPISFPGIADVVVTDSFRTALEGSGLTGFTFQPLIKARIVDLDWSAWDQLSSDPPVYPSSGEPEDYILERPHSEEMAARIGDLWEVCLEAHDPVERVWEIGIDWFCGRTELWVSERAKDWLQRQAGRWIAFEERFT
jgi:hypothetical protein